MRMNETEHENVLTQGHVNARFHLTAKETNINR